MKLFPPLKEISITEIEGLRIGNAQDLNAMTGVTVLRFDEGAKAGCDISGGGPASRETPLTSPVTADNPINAIVLSGGSAFGHGRIRYAAGGLSCRRPLRDQKNRRLRKKVVDLHALEAYAILVSVSDRMGAFGNPSAGK